ncbi:MAG: hypothetical protein MR316_00545 [Lachnospiraceae bacterium]|nr:hypothetical protein [Lachnospiraceae bacterium]
MKQVVNFCHRLSLWMTLVIGTILLVMSGISVVYYRKVLPGAAWIALEIGAVVALAIVLSVLAIKLYPKMEQTGRKTTIAIFVLIVLAQIAFLTLVSRPMSISDAARVQEEALAMAREQHGQMNMANDYFQRYTNNHFLTVLFYYFFKILNACRIEQIWLPLVILNTCFVDVGIYISYRTAKRLKGRGMANMVLLCFLLCPTTYVWLTTAYTNTMSFPFVIGILYLCLWLRGGKLTVKNIVKCILLGSFMAIGYWLRPTTILPILAMILFAAVKFFQEPILLPETGKQAAGTTKRRFNPRWNLVRGKTEKRNTVVKAVLVLAVFGVVYAGCGELVNRHVDQSKLTGEFPVTHWIMMGLNEESYGGFSRDDENFTRSFPTKEEKTKATIEETKHRLQRMGPLGLGRQLLVKMFRVWAMGDDDSLPKAGYAKEYPVLYEYVMGNNNGNFLLYTQAFRMCIFLFLCFSLVRQLREKQCSEMFLFALTFLGAVLFFMLWEANRKYNICFMGVYLILMADGMEYGYAGVFANRQDSHRKKVQHIAGRGLLVISAAAVVITQGVIWKQERHRVRRHFYQSRIVGDSVSVQEELGVVPYLLEQTLQQNQYVRKGQWNRLTLYFELPEQPILPSTPEYLIELQDQATKKVFYKQKIGIGDLNKKGEFVVAPEKMKHATQEGYLLRLTYIGKNSMQMIPKVSRFADFDAYPYGELRVNGKITKYDLSMGLQQQDS